MDQIIMHHEMTTTSTAEWMSYLEFAEEYYETPLPNCHPAPSEMIPENELPF